MTFNSAPDYETKTSYSITVNVSDGTNTTSQELTININDITESGLAPGSYDPNVYVTAETLNGGTGNDTMYGYDGDDIINGNDGDDGAQAVFDRWNACYAAGQEVYLSKQSDW